MNRNLIIWGYFGVNYGDDIMLLQIINEFSNKIKIYVIASNDISVPEFSNFKIISMPKFTTRSEFNCWLRSLPRNSIHVWGGGTIFTDEEGDGNFYPFIYLKLLKFLLI